MNTVSHKKNWNLGTVQVHLAPPPILIIKGKNDEKEDKYCVKIKWRRDMTSKH